MVIAQIAVTHDELAAHWAVFLATKPQKAWVSKFICNLFDFVRICQALDRAFWRILSTYILLMYMSMQLLQNL